MPQWAGSCWYYLRYLDPKNEKAFVDPKIEKYWMPVDLYVGGAEHAVLHLLYSRFWHKVLYDIGVVSTDEPFQRLINQGMILGEDNQKMSKSRGQRRQSRRYRRRIRRRHDARLRNVHGPLAGVQTLVDRGASWASAASSSAPGRLRKNR